MPLNQINMKKYYGNYLGIIIQNNDPLARGRVKIFVPHISPTVYKNWNENISLSVCLTIKGF